MYISMRFFYVWFVCAYFNIKQFVLTIDTLLLLDFFKILVSFLRVWMNKAFGFRGRIFCLDLLSRYLFENDDQEISIFQTSSYPIFTVSFELQAKPEGVPVV